ncbi:hypothetical protein BJV78DRAFT_1158413 [Lactifluus subvellereus]|nr:hypothetical protein BJV78DRAFT_1158413 [Lactifluus subvellereus]
MDGQATGSSFVVRNEYNGYALLLYDIPKLLVPTLNTKPRYFQVVQVIRQVHLDRRATPSAQLGQQAQALDCPTGFHYETKTNPTMSPRAESPEHCKVGVSRNEATSQLSAVLASLCFRFTRCRWLAGRPLDVRTTKWVSFGIKEYDAHQQPIYS